MTRIQGLTVLRGAAALAVLAFHVALLVAAQADAPVAAPFHHGWAGVDVFFALSAFLLARPLVGRAFPLGERRFWGDYLGRRALRIVPAYYASIVLALALGAGLVYVVEGWGDVLLHLLFAHGFAAGSYTSINPVYWTLAIEAEFYLVLPFLVWLLNRPRGLWIGAFLVGASVALRFAVYDTPAAFLAVQLPGFLAPFVLGIVAARLFVTRPVPSRRAAGSLVGAAVLLFAAALLALPAGSVTQALDSRWTATTVRPVLGAAAAALILGVAWCDQTGVRLGGVWLQRVAAWPGVVSYSLYLVHVPVLVWFAAGPGAGLVGHPTYLPILVGLPLAVAAVVHVVVERPFLAARGKRSHRAAAGAVPVGPPGVVADGNQPSRDPAS